MNAKQLRRSVLQLAISGRLVHQDPTDEPASAQLKKINSKAVPITDEIPFDIPDSWEWCRVRDLVQINPKIDCPDDTLVAFIPMEKIEAIYGSRYTYDEVKWGNIKEGYTHFANGDVAFAKITPCFQNRKSVVFNDLPNGIGAGTTELFVLRPYGEALNRWYLLYFLKSSYFIANARFKGTVNQQRVVRDYWEDKLFPLPPLAEQERIVKEVERWFACIEQLERSREALGKAARQTKRTLLSLAISGRLVPQDPADEPAIALLRRINPKATPITEEVPFTIPDSWCWCRVGDIFDHNTGKALNKSVDTEGQLLPYLTTSNVYWDKFDLTEVRKMYFKESEIDKCTVRKGDLLVCEGGDIGRSAIWNSDKTICIQNHLHRLRAKGAVVNHRFNLYVLMLFKEKQLIIGKGIGLMGLSSRTLDNLLIPLPPLAEQERIVGKVEELFAVLDALQ